MVDKKNTKAVPSLLNKVASDKQNRVTRAVDDLVVLGKTNSDVINLTLKNITPEGKEAKDITLVFGTPLGLSEEYQKVPLYDSIENHFLDDSDYIHDNDGANANFLKLLNRRVTRHAVIVRQIEVILPAETSENLSQATQPIKPLIVPLNSSENAHREGGNFVARDTENNYSYLVDNNKIYPWSDNVGFTYVLKSGAEVNLNILLAAYENPIMRMINE